MRRTFHPDEKVTLQCKDERVAAEVALISENQRAIAFTVDDYITIRDASGGMGITRAIPCTQDDDGRLTDLYGNEWRIV